MGSLEQGKKIIRDKISLNKKQHQDELEHHGRVIDDLQKKLKTAEAKNAVLEDKLKSKRKKVKDD